jgi:hypothetical protein
MVGTRKQLSVDRFEYQMDRFEIRKFEIRKTVCSSGSERFIAEPAKLEIVGYQFVKALAAALINLGGGRMDQVAM